MFFTNGAAIPSLIKHSRLSTTVCTTTIAMKLLPTSQVALDFEVKATAWALPQRTLTMTAGRISKLQASTGISSTK